MSQYLKFIFLMLCITRVFANDSIIISNQPAKKLTTLVISNRPSAEEEAFIKFQPQFVALKNLLEITSNEFYFASIAPDPANKDQLILYVTVAFTLQSEAKQTLLLTTLKNLWQEALGHSTGTIVVANAF